MFSRIVRLNIRLSYFLAKKFNSFFLGNKNYEKDLIQIVKSSIPKEEKLSILEIGGIDRPILKKNKQTMEKKEIYLMNQIGFSNPYYEN